MKLFGKDQPSAMDFQTTHTATVQCKGCNGTHWFTTVQFKMNPLTGPSGGLLPCAGHIYCAQCGLELGKDVPKTTGDQDVQVSTPPPPQKPELILLPGGKS